MDGGGKGTCSESTPTEIPTSNFSVVVAQCADVFLAAVAGVTKYFDPRNKLTPTGSDNLQTGQRLRGSFDFVTPAFGPC